MTKHDFVTDWNFMQRAPVPDSTMVPAADPGDTYYFDKREDMTHLLERAQPVQPDDLHMHSHVTIVATLSDGRVVHGWLRSIGSDGLVLHQINPHLDVTYAASAVGDVQRVRWLFNRVDIPGADEVSS